MGDLILCYLDTTLNSMKIDYQKSIPCQASVVLSWFVLYLGEGTEFYLYILINNSSTLTHTKIKYLLNLMQLHTRRLTDKK